MEEKKPFIKEKIKQKTSAGKTFRRIITVAACAIIFGVIAAIVLSMSAPIAEKVFGEKEETTTQQVVLIPRDELPAATVEETMPILTIADVGNESAELPTRDAAPEVIEPIQHLKVCHMGNRNPRLHMDEVLIALSICAVSDPLAHRAMDQLSRLAGSEAHATVILAHVDESLFKKLGVQVTCEPVYEIKKLLH